MEISIRTKQAYSEIDEFISLLPEEHKNKLPTKLKEFFAEEKDKQYKKNIDSSIPIKDQGLLEETLAIIALLNLQYWCESETEKQRLKEVYAKNEEKYQKMLQTEYNPNDIFKKKTSNVEKEQTHVENTQIVTYKEPLLKRIINKIKHLFKRKY